MILLLPIPPFLLPTSPVFDTIESVRLILNGKKIIKTAAEMKGNKIIMTF